MGTNHSQSKGVETREETEEDRETTDLPVLGFVPSFMLFVSSQLRFTCLQLIKMYCCLLF